MIKLLIGGSPCTYWSISQKNNRETEPSGLGWELFQNYLIAKEKFQPDFFLYENNKSAAEAIKQQIRKELKVWDGTFLMPDSGARYIEINSALVSAQNRQRFYVHNCGEVEQPEDRGILLKDILESGQVEKDKGYCLKHQSGNARDYFKKHHTNIKFELVTEPINTTVDGKSHAIKAQYHKNGVANFITNDGHDATAVAEPVRVGTYPSKAKNTQSKQYRVYAVDGKSTTLCGEGGGMGAKTGLYAIPDNSDIMYVKEAAQKGYAEIYPGECVDLCQENSATQRGRKMAEKSNCLTRTNSFYEYCGTADKPIYEVRDGKITIKGKQYPIKLKDGYYIIRKLTVTECCRLQTMPDDYCRAVSDSQAYKGLGNGWTAEVIIHILSHALKNVPRDEKIVVLSMYDGIGTGRYCLDKMGFTNVEYHAYEIDKYAMKIAMSNYPDIIQHGDAYQVREKDWHL